MKSYSSCFRSYRRDVSEQARQYACGLMQGGDRKNMEHMSEVVPEADARNLQQFLTHSKWDHRAVIKQVGHDVSEELGESNLCGLIIDESGFEKQGKFSAGVARQWLGRLGKVDNGQVGVFGVLASETRVAPIDARLYLPKSWCEDADRCKKAGIPEDERAFRTKIELALNIVIDARKEGLHFDWTGADAGYGKGLVFIDALDEMDETFMVDVHSDFTVYQNDPKPYLPKWSGKGRKPSRWKSAEKGIEVSTFIKSLAQTQWQRVCVRETTRGKMRLEVAVESVFVWDITQSKTKEFIIVATRSLDHGDLKISISNANSSTPRTRLAFMQRQRFWVERAFEDGKSECGMADYQCRKWTSWHHHMALVMMTMLFMLKERKHQKEAYPLLSASDIEMLLVKFLPKRATTPDEIITQLKDRHKRRCDAIKSHAKTAERAYQRARKARWRANKKTSQNP